MTNRILPRSRGGRIASLSIVGVLLLSLLSGCSLSDLLGSSSDSWKAAFDGIHATLSTYDVNGVPADQIKGESLRIDRDTEFDTTDEAGNSQNDSSVLLVSLGDHHMHIVGSTTILVEDGLNDVTAQVPAQFRFTNRDKGTPWLNDLKFQFTRFWHNDSKTVVIKSQFGTPIAVYTGVEVQLKSTEVPKSTWFRIKGSDGVTRTLWVYRATYTSVDTELLGK